jgi:hypothetical protein
MGEILDIHLRIHDKDIREYHSKIGDTLERPSRHYENLIKIGLTTLARIKEGKDILRRKESTLPAIDQYYLNLISGISVVSALKRGAISPEQLELIYRGAREIIQDVECDRTARDSVRLLRDIYP